MNEILSLLIVGAIVFSSFTLEGITGFGCTVIALPFVTMLLGIRMTVPFLCVLSTLLSIYIFIRSYRSLCWKEYLFIALHVAPGLPVGMYLFNRLPAAALCLLLACVMVIVGLHGFFKTVREKQNILPAGLPPKNLFMRGILFLGGIIHGAFGTGGPFVVIYASRALPEKGLFRLTLTMLWLTMNFIRIGEWMYQGTVFTPQFGKYLLMTLPFVVAGMIFGDYLHRKVNEHSFRQCVYSVLCVSGVVMFFANLVKVI